MLADSEALVDADSDALLTLTQMRVLADSDALVDGGSDA